MEENISMAELEQYLEFLYGTDTGYVYAPTLSRTLDWDQNWFQWPQQKLALTDFIRTASKDGNVHIAPPLYTTKDATRKGVSHSNVVWCEFDGTYTGDFKGLPEPHLQIRSSKDTKVHCYWKTERLDSSKAIEEITRRLAYFLDADTACWNVNRVLRPPETFNYKYGAPLPVTTLSFLDGRVDSKIFDKAPVLQIRPFIASEIEIKAFRATLGKYPIPDALRQEILTKKPKEHGRSTFLYKVAADLADVGANEVDIISVLYHVDERVRKFADRSDKLERYASIATTVALKRLAESSSRVYTFEEMLNVKSINENWLLPDLIAAGDIGVLFGMPSIGKTQLALDWCEKLSAGLPILGREIKPIDVLMVSLEMNEAGINYVISKQVEDYDLKSLSRMKIAFLQSASHEEIRMDIEAYRPQLVVIDSIFAMSIDELDQKEAARIFGPLQAMCKEYGVAFLMIHHITKEGSERKGGPTLKDLFGTIKIHALISTAVAMYEENEQLYLKLVKTRWTVKEEHNLIRTPNLTFTTTLKGGNAIASNDTRAAGPGSANLSSS